MSKHTSAWDGNLQTIESLTWLPWIGSDFVVQPKEERFLIVGESHYVRATSPELLGDVIKQHLDNHSYTRDIVAQCLVNREWRNRTLDNVAKLLFSTTEIDRLRFWKTTAFYNCVQRPMNYTQKGWPERPNQNDFLVGWKVFANIARLLQPTYCLFIGVEAANTFNTSMKTLGLPFQEVKRTEKVGRTWARSASIDLGGSTVRLIFVQHLGKYFSWRQWHHHLRKHNPELFMMLDEKQYRR